MGTRDNPMRGRNAALAAEMISPYAGTGLIETGVSMGGGAVAAVLGMVGGGVAYGIARHRTTPDRMARRTLRNAARVANASAGTRRRSPSFGSKGRTSGVARRAAAGRMAGARRTATATRSAGGSTRGGGRRGSTALLDRTAGSRGRSTASRSAGTSARRVAGSGRTPFGRGPRATAARQRAAARGWGSSPNGRGRGRSGGMRGLAGSAWRGWRRRARAASAAIKRARTRRPMPRWKTPKSRAGKWLRRAWRPFGRLWGRPRRRGLLSAGWRGLSLLARGLWGLGGTVVAGAALLPRVWQWNRNLGRHLARHVSVGRAGLSALIHPFEAEREAERIAAAAAAPAASTNNIATGGIDMADATAPHIDALIEQIRNAPQIDKFSGVAVAAHAEALPRLMAAIAEYAGASLDVIRERLPMLDGGESLVSQVDIAYSAAQAMRECHESYEATHEDRLRRQRDPQAGEENWDVAAAQD